MKKIISTGPPGLLRPDEAAAMLRTEPRTLAKWADSGLLPEDAWIRLPGGHRRYRRTAIDAILNGHAGGRS